MKCPWTIVIAPVLAIAVFSSGCRSDSEHSERTAQSAPSAPAQPSPRANEAKASGESKPAELKPVAKIAAKGAALGEIAPDFTLKDLDGREHKLSSYRGKVVVLEWFSPSCPYCVYGYGDGPLKEMPESYMSKGMAWLSINSNAPERPDASVAENREFVEKHAMKAPLLMDPTGSVGRAYGAKSTPHMFVIDEKGVLVYKGALDNAPAGKVDNSGTLVNYVDAAIADLKSGKPIQTAETRSYG